MLIASLKNLWNQVSPSAKPAELADAALAAASNAAAAVGAAAGFGRDAVTVSSSAAVALRDRQAGPTTLSGSFLQINGTEEPQEHWDRMLGEMKRVGMDTAIVQFSASEGVDMSANTEKILKAADALGMKVMVGTVLNERMDSLLGNWYVRQYSGKALKADAEEVSGYTRDMVARFAHHPSLAGVYIPYEVNATADAEEIGDFYGAIARAAKEAKPDLKVMISPYTNLIPGVALSRSSGALTKWWDTVLSRAPIDILAWQDGVGGTEKQLARVDHDLGAIAKATEKHGVELWGNLETFHRTTKLTEGFDAEPTSLDTFKRQVEATKPYVSKLINFDFNHYMDPERSPEAKRFYEGYQQYLAEQQPAS